MSEFSNKQLAIEELPQLSQLVFKKLAYAAPWEAFWQTCINAVILLGVLLAIWFFVPGIATKFTVMAISVFVAFFIFFQWHNFASYKYKGIALREQDIIFKRGMIWRSTTIVPFKRVQHMEIHRNPIERKLDLASLKIFTAGGMGADLKISGLHNNEAEKLKQYILSRTETHSLSQDNEGE